MFDVFVNNIYCNFYAGEELQSSMEERACFGNINSYIKKDTTSCHYILRNNLENNEESIRKYFQAWNRYSQTKDWFDIDKIIKDNGYIFTPEDNVSEVQSKICIIRAIDEFPRNRNKLIDNYDYPDADKLIAYAFNTVSNSGHWLWLRWNSKIKYTPTKNTLREYPHMTGTWKTWNSIYTDVGDIVNL